MRKGNEVYFGANVDINKLLFSFVQKLQLNIDTRDLVECLNSINNQEIEEIDLLRFTYRRKGKELSLFNLSSSERVFFISWLAVSCNKQIYVRYNGIWLRPATWSAYLRYFVNKDVCNNICFVVDDTFDVSVYSEEITKYA